MQSLYKSTFIFHHLSCDFYSQYYRSADIYACFAWFVLLDIPLYADSCRFMYSVLWFTYLVDDVLQNKTDGWSQLGRKWQGQLDNMLNPLLCEECFLPCLSPEYESHLFTVILWHLAAYFSGIVNIYPYLCSESLPVHIGRLQKMHVVI